MVQQRLDESRRAGGPGVQNVAEVKQVLRAINRAKKPAKAAGVSLRFCVSLFRKTVLFRNAADLNAMCCQESFQLPDFHMGTKAKKNHREESY
jgi:hypothetical protein